MSSAEEEHAPGKKLASLLVGIETRKGMVVSEAGY